MDGWQPPRSESVFPVLVQSNQQGLDEQQLVESFVRDGCSCPFGPDSSPCCRQFQPEHYHEMRCWCSELTKQEKDLMIKGQLMAMTNTSKITKHSTTHQHSYQERVQQRTYYLRQGLSVCESTFRFLHCLGRSVYKAIRRSCREKGLAPRVHGNTRRLPYNTISFDDVQLIVSFIRNYAEDHVILLPGRIPGYKRTDLQLLPSCTTKRSVWLLYKEASVQAIDSERRSVAYSSFCRIWKQLLPNILPLQPMTDLCPICHKYAGLISCSSNLSEADKSEVIIKTIMFARV